MSRQSPTPNPLTLPRTPFTKEGLARSRIYSPLGGARASRETPQSNHTAECGSLVRSTPHRSLCVCGVRAQQLSSCATRSNGVRISGLRGCAEIVSGEQRECLWRRAHFCIHLAHSSRVHLNRKTCACACARDKDHVTRTIVVGVVARCHPDRSESNISREYFASDCGVSKYLDWNG